MCKHCVFYKNFKWLHCFSYDSYLGFIFQIKDFLTAVFRNKVYFALKDHKNQANTRRVEVVSDKLNEKEIPIM